MVAYFDWRRRAVLRLGLLPLLSLTLILEWSPAPSAPAPPPSLEESLRKARVNGTYEMLLRQIEVKKDADKYGRFLDYGFREIKTYAGHTDLPSGYWVYVAPYWYIWRDLAAAPKNKRAWGPEQATGKPDTLVAGDQPTAWASKNPDDQDEWLLLEYAQPVVPAAVLIYETFNPGAVTRVTVFKLDGTEVEVWSGNDPTAATSSMGTSEIPIKVHFKTNRVKIYLDSPAVPGWNEIDAVGLRDQAKKTQWATAAEASSTYAQGPYVKLEYLEQRVRQLEAELRQVQQANRELRKKLKERMAPSQQRK